MTVPTTTALTTTIQTADGPFSVVSTTDGVVLASGWTAQIPGLVALIHPTMRPESTRPVPSTDPGVAAAVHGATAYYDGELGAIDAVLVHQVSGPFRSHAWTVLRKVAPGTPVTYAHYAELCGRPAAIRAAAGACAMNAAALFVPCHRIVRTDGSLGGFRYGLDIKQSLLAREANVEASLPLATR